MTVIPAGIAAGTCQGSVSIAATNPDSGAAAPNSPLVIPVTMYISNSALLTFNQSALTFTTQQNGQPPAQTITLGSTSSTDQLTYHVETSTPSGVFPWLQIGPTSGSTAPGLNTLTVQVNPGILSPGNYTGMITVTAQGPGGAAVADSPVTIPVTFQVTAGTLTVDQTSLSFSLVAGSAPPPGGKQIKVTNTNTAALNYTVTISVGPESNGVNWLGAAPLNGTTPGTVLVNADASKLSPGTYKGTVTITSLTAFTGSNPAIVPVTLTVTAGTVSVSPTSLTFTQAPGAPAPPAQTVTVTFSPTALPFTVTTSTKSGSGWLTATASTTNNTVSVSVNSGNLTVGQYDGTVTVSATGAGSVDIPVRLNVVAAATLTVTPSTAQTFNFVIGSTTTPAAKSVQVSTSADPSTFTATVQTDNGGNGWLQVTPSSGATPATVSIAVNPQGLTANTYTGKVTFTSPVSATPVVVNVTFTVVVVAPPVIRTVNNAASYATGSVSPGENIVIFGTGLGPATLAVAAPVNGVFPTTSSNTQVFFDSLPAPILYVSDGVSSVMVPYGVSGRATTVIKVVYQGVTSDPLTYTVSAAAPGIYSQNFSGAGPGVIRNIDGSLNGPGAPVAKGSAVFLIMTGEGVTDPASTDGKIAPVDGTGLNKPRFTATATIGGVPANVEYIGSYPGIVYGAAQVNIRIPAGASSGTQELIITLTNGSSSFSTQRQLTINVQ